MRNSLALGFWLMTLGVTGAYQSEFYEARKQWSSNPEGAEEMMKRSFRLAVDAGNGDYATAAGNSACTWMHERFKTVEAGRLAREVIDALQPMGYRERDNDALRRAVLFGYLERGLLMEGKISAAWQANRAAAENLRGNPVGTAGDGPSITVEDIAKTPAERKSLAWRLVEREADLLDYMGRTQDARVLLDKAAAVAGDQWPKLEQNERFYVFKLLSRRCELLDYLGYDLLAIDAQKALLLAGKGIPLRNSYLTLQINLLRNLSQWEGPTEEILAQARDLVKHIEAGGPGNGASRLLAKMELDLKLSQEAIDALRSIAKETTNLGHFLDAAYADRDSLVSRAKSGEAGLDGEFISILNRMRAQGNKRGEPTLYAEYASYLLSQNRPAEAIIMFTEALRLKRAFGLLLHEPPLLAQIFNARFQSGDIHGADAALAELEGFLVKHSAELPIARRVDAEARRASALAQLGRKDAAKAVLENARRLAAVLPPYRRILLDPDQQSRILQPDRPVPTASVTAPIPLLRIQPLEVVRMAAPGRPAATRFLISNPTAAGIAGACILTGPGAVLTSAGRVDFTAGKPEAALKFPLTVPGGGDASIEVTLAPAASTTEQKILIAWSATGGETSPASTWEVKWQTDPTGRVVLDASLLETNPFRSVSLFHELAVATGNDLGIPFRLRSPVPLRLEYYDALSQRLLAVDANGNGDFTEGGDLFSHGPSGVACAVIPACPERSTLTLEIRIFAPTGEPLAITSPLVLESEVHRDGKWVKEAESMLR